MTRILQVFCKNSKLSGEGVNSDLQNGPDLSKICRKLCHLLLLNGLAVVDAAILFLYKQINYYTTSNDCRR